MTRPARQSFVRCPLTDILATSGQVRVLRVLALHGGALAPARVARSAGLTAPGVRLALAALVRTQVVTILGSGRTQLYQFDRAHPIAKSVRDLFLKEAKHWEALLGADRKSVV